MIFGWWLPLDVVQNRFFFSVKNHNEFSSQNIVIWIIPKYLPKGNEKVLHNSPPRTSHDIWVVAPSGYGPSCEVASRPASFTMTGTLGGTEKSMKKMALLTLLAQLLETLQSISNKRMCMLIQRKLKLDGAKGYFAYPLWKRKNTMTGTLGGTEKSMKKMALLTLLAQLLETLY